MAKRWKMFENELATHHGPSPGYTPSPGVSFSIRLPHGFEKERDEARLIKIAAKYDLEIFDPCLKGWGTQQRFAWLTYSSEISTNQYYSNSNSGTHFVREKATHSMLHCLNRGARRNGILGRKWCSHARVRDRIETEWKFMETWLDHFGGFLIANGLSGDTRGEGDDHLIFTLPTLFNEARDVIKIRKLTKRRGLVWVGCFVEDGRKHGLWVAPDKGMTFSDALLLLEHKRQPNPIL